MLLNYNRKELSGLSTLRFALAIYLTMFHTVHEYKGLPNWIYEFTSSGYMATSMFFLLSGFTLAHVYLGNEGLKITTREFLWTRLLTLYPLHLVGIAISIVIYFLQWRVNHEIYGVADIPPQLTGYTHDLLLIPMGLGEALANLLAHLALVHAWTPFMLTFNIPSWSISALVFFYFAFVGFGHKLVSTSRPQIIFVVLNLIYLVPPVFFAVNGYFNAVSAALLHTNPLLRLPEFLAGIVLYKISKDLGGVVTTRAKFILLMVLAWAGLLSINHVLVNQGPAGYFVAHNGGLLIIQAFIIVLFAGIRDFRSPFKYKWMKRLGASSLSIFVLHLPVFYLLTRVEKLVVSAISEGFGTHWISSAKAVELNFAFYPIIVLGIVAVSIFCQEYFVFKFRDFLKRALYKHQLLK